MEDRRNRKQMNALTEDQAAAVEIVFAENVRFIENVVRQHAFRPDDVPDIVQSVGVQVCRSLSGSLSAFRGNSHLRTWLYRVSVNASRDHYRRERQQLRSQEAVAQTLHEGESVLDPDEQVHASQKLDAVLEAAAKMRPHHRQAIRNLVRYHSGVEPIQPDEGSTVEGARSRLFRARRELRSILSDDPRFEE